MVMETRSGETHYSQDFIQSKVVNAEPLRKSLSAGSKKRLKEYQNNLAITRGLGKPLFDDKVVALAREFAWDKASFDAQLAYLNHLRDSDGYLFSRNLKIYSTCQSAIERFAEGDYTSFRWNRNYQKSLKWLKDEFSSLKLRPLDYCCDDDIIEAIPKSNTHSGFTYILSGKKKKGDNMDGIFKKYQDKLEYVYSNGTFSTPILIGFRTQASGEYEDDGSCTGTCRHKLRVVSMVDLMTIIAELKFAKPFQSAMSKKDFYAGGKDEREISKILYYWRSRFARFMSIDYSSFDQTISSWLIEDAFDVIKSAFVELSDYDERVWNAMVHDFIHKDFVINEGIVHSDKGVPSGSMWTQIVDSVVNVLVIQTYFHSIAASCKMMAMGDDNIIFTSSGVSLGELSSYVAKNFGLIVKVDDKSNEGSTNDDPKFLSRYWTNHGEWRHPNQLISRLAFPERRRDYSGDITPAHVLTAFILTYYAGMQQLIDVPKFMNKYRISRKDLLNKVDSRYLPGALAYIREYTSGGGAA